MTEIHESLGKLSELFAVATKETLPILKKAHKLFLEIHPDVVIVPRLGEKSISYGLGPKKNSEAYCYLIAYKSHVNLGFFHGSRLGADDILEGTGPLMRHLKITSLEQLDSPKVRRLIKAALKDRKVSLPK
ncbi:MAG: hypothetical protein RLZZ41_733 [Actinomycetota bacterium]|jgi:hypothetical protein